MIEIFDVDTVLYFQKIYGKIRVNKEKSEQSMNFDRILEEGKLREIYEVINHKKHTVM